MYFILFTAIIVIISMIILTRPIVRNKQTSSYDRLQQNIHFAQERLTELEAQLKNAAISHTDYEALKLEIEQTLAEELEQHTNTTEKHISNKFTAITLSIVLPVLTIAIYLIIGKPEAFLNKTEPTTPNQQQIAGMLSGLEQRLKAEPNDPNGWTLLGRSYLVTGQFQQAIDAYKKVLSLTGENADALVQLADAIALSKQGNMHDEPGKLIMRALELDKNHPQGLWLAGMYHLQLNQPDKAIRYWQTLLPLMHKAPEQQERLTQLIERARNMQAGSTNQQTNQVEKIASKTINVQVTLDATLQTKVQASDTVFVFAKAKQGPPAPLAVKRIKVADLPANITLSDSDAMMPQLTISKFPNIIVNARISKSGNAIAQSGDIESDHVIANTKENIFLTLKNIIE